MARVSAYLASDNTLHRDRKLYLTHEQNLQAIPKIRELIASKVPASDGTPEGDAAREALVDSQLKLLTDTIGLSTLREILNVRFVAKESDGEDGEGAGTGAEAAAATGGAEI